MRYYTAEKRIHITEKTNKQTNKKKKKKKREIQTCVIT